VQALQAGSGYRPPKRLAFSTVANPVSVARLSAGQLQEARQLCLEEIVRAERDHGADRKHIRGLLQLLTRIEARLERLQSRQAATLERRQLIASEKASVR
jgi:hypothetical protein